MTPTKDRQETNWYTVKVQNNHEKKVKDRIALELTRAGREYKIVVPIERTFVAKDGKKKAKEKVLYPGYIFVEIGSVSELQAIVRGVSGATNVVAGKDKIPVRLKKHEVISMLLAEEELLKPISDELYIVGEVVKIIDGAFKDFNGPIETIDMEAKKVKVAVPIFGRSTSVEMSFEGIAKI